MKPNKKSVFHHEGKKKSNPLLFNSISGGNTIDVSRKDFKARFNKFMSEGKSVYLDYNILDLHHEDQSELLFRKNPNESQSSYHLGSSTRFSGRSGSVGIPYKMDSDDIREVIK